MTGNVKDIGAARKKRPAPQRDPADWERGLAVTKKGPRKTLANVLHVLACHPDWEDVIGYDEFSERVVKLRPPPTRPQDRPEHETAGDWTESDTTRTCAWFASAIGFEPSVSHVQSAVCAVAERKLCHPVRDWLRSLKWDGVARLDSLLVTFFGAVDDDYVRAAGARFAIGAVARVMRPGCKLDTVLVLEGPQGAKKSTAWRELTSPGWFLDSGLVIGDKDTYQSMHGKWICELAELSALKSAASVEKIKAFLSSPVDHYRPSYARVARDFPRQNVFVASTNESHYLVDPTGNRRFWPVRVGRIDLEAIRRDRDQLWAEAVHRFDADEPWYLDTDELISLASDAQAEREQRDDWLDLFHRWLNAPTVPVDTSSDERRLLKLEEGVTTLDVQLGAIGITADRITSGTSARAGYVLRKAGFEPRQIRVPGDHERRERRYFRSQREAKDATSDGASDDGAGVNTPKSHVTDVTGNAHTHDHTAGAYKLTTQIGNPGATPGTRDGDVEREAIQMEAGA